MTDTGIEQTEPFADLGIPLPHPEEEDLVAKPKEGRVDVESLVPEIPLVDVVVEKQEQPKAVVEEPTLPQAASSEIAQELEERKKPLNQLFDKAFTTVGADDQCQELRLERREKGKPVKMSKKGREWAQKQMEDWLAQGHSAEEIRQQVARKRKELQNEKDSVTQRLLLRSLDTRARREAEKDLRQGILEQKGRLWRTLGLTAFERNYLTEMELARRRKGEKGELGADLKQLKKEIKASLGVNIKKARRWAKGRIGRRLQQLGINL